MNDSPNRDVEVFTEAVQLPANERAAYLECACGGDGKLRGQVEALLHSHDQAGDFLEQSPKQSPTEGASKIPVGEKPGDQIGRYKLLQQIGEGGCGVVFMAEQDAPVRRRVALKIIKPGMDTKSVIARFEAERQALALMDHPNIAKIFDAGATESGRPYFVMELIRGIKITEYCDQHSLTTEERLKLFVHVCQAVQHAHQKGIIHRDIKPSNILVTTTLQGAAMPVVIDFGIAKATTNQRLTDKTLFTAFEMLIGTPAYMSPEQAALTSVDVDTRTDIYSLGVLLYELLTGLTPFDTGDLLKAGLDEIRRVIRDEEPVRPSTRLSKMTGADLTTVANHRQSEPPILIRAVRGDLDWIAMKALEKDRTRRYETANGLALDVQRYLTNEPVSARPPSKLYKLQKTVLRNKLLFIGAGIIALLLVVSLIIVSTSLANERRSRQEADAARLQAETDKHIAQTEAAKSKQVTQFLEDMLQGVGPSVAMGRDTMMLLEILNRTAERVGSAMTNQPAVEAELRGLIGRLYWEIGKYDQAEKMQRAAWAINRKLFGTESAEAAASLNDLGLALDREGNLAAAESTHQEALGLRRRLFGNENAGVATSLNNLATVFRHQGRSAEAETLTREALEIRKKLFGADSLEVADTLHNLSVVLSDEGKQAESKKTAQEMLAMRQRLLGNEHPLVASAMVDVAWAANGSSKYDEAESMGEQALAMQRKLLGDEHPEVARSLSSLGQLLEKRGSLPEAEDVLRAALSMQRKVLGEENLDTLYTLRSLAWTLEAEGKWDEAETAHREVLALWRKRVGNDDPQVLAELRDLARILSAQKNFGEAEQFLDETLTPAFVKQPSSVNFLVQRVNLMGRQGRWQEAAADVSLVVNHQPSEYYHYYTLAPLLVITGDRPAYEQLCQKTLPMFSDTMNPYVAERIGQSCLLLPNSGADLGLLDKLADKAVTRGSGEASLPFFQVFKAMSNYRLGHFPEAIEWAEKALKSSLVEAQARAYAILAMAHWQLGQKDEARAMLVKGNALMPNFLSSHAAVEDIGDQWLVWLFARIQLDEAAALIQPASVTDHTSSKSSEMAK